MAAWLEDDVEVNGLRLHYTRTGGDKPTVVLTHGVTDDGRCWSAIAEPLSEDYDLIMSDARGHGRSDAPEQGYSSDLQAADLAALIRALGLTRPAVLGHSMGAATALVMAGTEPDVPGAIILEDPPSWWLPRDDGDAADQRRVGMGKWFMAVKRQSRDELIAAIRRDQPGWSETEQETWADAKVRFSPYVLDLLRPNGISSIDWTATLRRITCPTTLIYADPERGGIVSAEAAEALRALIPHVKTEYIAGAGHNIRRDQPERFLQVVRAALAEWAAGRSDHRATVIEPAR
ncbi:MAG: alpha/beta hydrolase [Chloroflexota bacterium]|nr:alpha/beta hydrolase [Chloroflexota bacterium]